MDPFIGLSDEARRRLRPADHPTWVAPMLATLTDRPFSDLNWLFERKLDGERCLAFRNGAEVRLFSRTRRPLNRTYPEITDALGAQRSSDFVIDGEVVAFEGNRTSFSALQQRIGIVDPERARRSPVHVFFYAFDVLFADGHDATGLRLRDRKAVLRRTLDPTGPLRLTPHRNGDGEKAFAEACHRGWEGVVAKRADSTYQSRRSTSWLKVKCSSAQEVVVGGFTEPSGSRTGLGALLIGYYDGSDLIYAGKVGTGFTDATLVDLRRRLDGLGVTSSPFVGGTVTDRGVHWVRPEMVAQVGFTEWTSDGKLRHPRFLGVRDDKAAADVRRDRPAQLR